MIGLDSLLASVLLQLIPNSPPELQPDNSEFSARCRLGIYVDFVYKLVRSAYCKPFEDVYNSMNLLSSVFVYFSVSLSSTFEGQNRSINAWWNATFIIRHAQEDSNVEDSNLNLDTVDNALSKVSHTHEQTNPIYM